ncbi:hypothetical protein [Aeromonas cavernicola]|uniref:DUF2946 domain-containing protein n=1 Tax=Aeromonas cavernicola TaxID=1006623 RepID=A0A2H9U8S1_9GAMM|nr:hypothetical protein [Aeromonas cavernicola]PJG60414.1 hypothetical protein CUC53_01870 [Aeromonas cavernicola]
MVLSRRQFAHARRWLPLWSLLLVLMSFGSRAATDLCALSTHCSQSERTLEQAMPCGSFTAVLAISMVLHDSLQVAVPDPDNPDFIAPPLFIPDAPCERLERPPQFQV